jgi:uncharacterized phiE125 gp8 family phage protein
MDIEIVKKDQIIDMLPEVKGFLSINHNESDGLLKQIIECVTAILEDTTQSAMRTLHIKLTHQNNIVRLPYLPIMKIISVHRNKVELTKAADITMDTYKFFIEHGRQAGIETAPNLARDDVISVEYIAGYSNDASIPQSYKNSILLCAKLVYQDRDTLSDMQQQISKMLEARMPHVLA